MDAIRKNTTQIYAKAALFSTISPHNMKWKMDLSSYQQVSTGENETLEAQNENFTISISRIQSQSPEPPAKYNIQTENEQ